MSIKHNCMKGGAIAATAARGTASARVWVNPLAQAQEMVTF